MKESAIENFIDYCDDMMIAEERFSNLKDNLFRGFKEILIKIKYKIKEFIINFNKLKTVRLPEKFYKTKFKPLLKEMYKVEFNCYETVHHFIKHPVDISTGNLDKHYKYTEDEAKRVKTKFTQMFLDEYKEDIQKINDINQNMNNIINEFNVMKSSSEMIELNTLEFVTSMKSSLKNIESIELILKDINKKYFSDEECKLYNEALKIYCSYYSTKLSFLAKIMKNQETSLANLGNMLDKSDMKNTDYGLLKEIREDEKDKFWHQGKYAKNKEEEPNIFKFSFKAN